jgi:Zn finger protein HypA/HybF involved in hydrogenase expression
MDMDMDIIKKPPTKTKPLNIVCIRCGESLQPEYKGDFVCPACKAKKNPGSTV